MTSALIVEDFLARWMRETEQGQSYVDRFGHDRAMDALFELLNAGFVKLERRGTTITGIVPCSPPDPPAEPMARPAKQDR